MSAKQWLKIPVTAALLIFSLASQAQKVEELGEGFDKQTDEEIALAEQHVRSLGFNYSDEPIYSQAKAQGILDKYKHLDPKHEVPTDLLETAILYFDAHRDKFTNQNFVTIVDFRHRSDTWRFYLVDVISGAVQKFHTTHGIGSDRNKNGVAETFGNVPNSGKSSLGFALVAEVYSGKFGRSVRLDGLSKTNSNLRRRAVVVHGWDDVKEDHVIQGLSWGCVTLDWKLKDGVIDKIASGSLLYIGQSVKK